MNMTRTKQITRLKQEEFDILIVGGGATGSGAALDAARRGLKVALIEKKDFAAGTSSRSTKLIHGGVRYLAQLHFGLIHESLSERKRLLRNAPHMVKPLKFVMPTRKFYEKPYYSAGMTLYDLLAWGSKLPRHKRISKEQILTDFEALNPENLNGGISYYDSQFNDSRLNVILAKAAEKEGACVVNRFSLDSFIKEDGKIVGANVLDELSKKKNKVKAKVVINTTGPWIDEIRKKDEPDTYNVIMPSQGIHLVFSKKDIPCESALIIPKTKDGRVVFMVPWEEHVIVGTTDTPLDGPEYEPLPVEGEVDFLLETANDYLTNPVSKKQILSVFIGIRPLVSPEGNRDTKSISREEVILVSESGLVSMGGGKWSTYRKMAEDLIDRVIEEANLEHASSCTTYDYELPGKVGYTEDMDSFIANRYGIQPSAAKRIQEAYGGEAFQVFGNSATPLWKGADYFKEEISYFIAEEFALSVLDVLARRFRVLFLDLALAEKMVSPVAKIMAKELKWTPTQQKAQEKEAKDLIKQLKDQKK